MEKSYFWIPKEKLKEIKSKQAEWISVLKELPEDEEDVWVIDNTLAAYPKPRPVLAYYDEEDKGFICVDTSHSYCIRVTHWMKVPPFPMD